MKSGGGILFEAVRLNRGGRLLFDDFSLRLTERRVGLVGDNGSGKSSLLRLINGLILPDGGRVMVEGLETARQRKELPARVGFVFQNPDHQILFPTVGEEVAFGLSERGLDRREAEARARTLLAGHGCAGWEGRAVHELSDGQKQLVCIVAAVAAGPSILLFDEPFASLDLPTRHALAERLAALPQQIVMASHDFELIKDFDRVIWLDHGRIRLDGRPAEVIEAYRAAACGAVAGLPEPVTAAAS